MACSRLSKRKMMTAFLPLCWTKAYMYSTLTPAVGQDLEHQSQSAGAVRHLHRHHFRLADGEALVLQDLPGLIVLVHDEPQDAEIRGVGQGEGPDVDPGFAQNPGDFRQAAGLVLQKYRYLFDFHGVPPFNLFPKVLESWF